MKFPRNTEYYTNFKTGKYFSLYILTSDFVSVCVTEETDTKEVVIDGVTTVVVVTPCFCNKAFVWRISSSSFSCLNCNSSFCFNNNASFADDLW